MQTFPHGLRSPETQMLRRPSRRETLGINWQSPQAVGLVAWWPLWGAAEGLEVEMTRGLKATIFGSALQPSYDRQFGSIAQGGGDGNGAGTARVIRIPNKDYFKPGLIAGRGEAWAHSFWFKTLSNASAALDQVIWSYNTGTNPWPGNAITLDTSNQLACNTESAMLGDAGVKSTMNPFDQKWHHCLFVQIPSGVPTTYSSTNIYYIDGVQDTSSSACAQCGDPGTRDAFFMGDEVGSPPLGGWMTDFRTYAGLKDLSFARMLFKEQTRWDLYVTSSMFVPKTAASGSSAALSGTAVGGISETDIIAGGKTIVITLTGDTFIPA